MNRQCHPMYRAKHYRWSTIEVRPTALSSLLTPALYKCKSGGQIWHSEVSVETHWRTQPDFITFFANAVGKYFCTALICGAESKHQSRVRPSVFPSVVCCGFAAVGPAGRRYRSIASRRTAARRAAGECGQCHVVGVRRRLSTDLFRFVYGLCEIVTSHKFT